MECEKEYNELTALTEKLHEIYYQQESAEFAFSNALSSAQNHLIATGLVSLASATAAQILNVLDDGGHEGFTELHDAAASKVQIDAAVRSLEESYRDVSGRYDDCIKQTEKKIVKN